MDVLTFVSHIMLYALVAGIAVLINIRVGQYLSKANDKNLERVKTDLEFLKKRLSELSVKAGLKDVFNSKE